MKMSVARTRCVDARLDGYRVKVLVANQRPRMILSCRMAQDVLVVDGFASLMMKLYRQPDIPATGTVERQAHKYGLAGEGPPPRVQFSQPHDFPS